MTIVKLKKGEGRIISQGGLWVYDNEIAEVSSSYHNGDIVEVDSYKDDFLGYGYINNNSKIRIRLLTRNSNDVIDDDFFVRRLRKVWNYRKKVVKTDSCRVVFSDSDFLPGLVIDKFMDTLVFEFDTLGMDIRKKQIVNCLLKVLNEDGLYIDKLYERSDAKVRTLEGLDRIKGFLGKEFDTNILIDEEGVSFLVDIANGQKTGHFLDQRDNHYAIRKITKNAKVLDVFTHTGGFALSAAKNAREVIGVDYSSIAITQARRNAKINNFTNVSFVESDAFEYLKKAIENKERYDVIILDPPAFTKTKSSLKNATKGYKEINNHAMKLLNDGGFLVTCSCSEYMNKDLFLNTIFQASKDAHKRLKLVERRSQRSDHPIILGNNVSDYLKCFIFEVNNR